MILLLSLPLRDRKCITVCSFYCIVKFKIFWDSFQHLLLTETIERWPEIMWQWEEEWECVEFKPFVANKWGTVCYATYLLDQPLCWERVYDALKCALAWNRASMVNSYLSVETCSSTQKWIVRKTTALSPMSFLASTQQALVSVCVCVYLNEWACCVGHGVKFSVDVSGSSARALVSQCCCIVGPETLRLQLQPVWTADT